MKTLSLRSLAFAVLTTLSFLPWLPKKATIARPTLVPQRPTPDPKHTKGQKSRYRQTQTTDSTSEVMGQKSKSLSVLTLRV